MKEELRFRQWWEKVSPRLRRSIARIIGDDSIDIIQDVSVMAIQRFDAFADYESFKRWCYIRAKWLAFDELSRKRRHESNNRPPPEHFATAEQDRRRQELHRMIANLPPRQREVTEARLDGYTSDEIAEHLNIAPTTVRSLWRFARQALIRMTENDTENHE